MELIKVEQKRRGLQQALILIVTILTAMMLYFSRTEVSGDLISTLAVICLLTCLYVLAKERKLRNLESRLRNELVTKERQLEEGHSELAEEKQRADDLHGRLMEIATLYRAINKINSETDDRRTVSSVLRAALELVGGDRGSVMLVDKDKKYMHVAGAVGLKEGIVNQARQKIGQGVSGWVAQFGEPTLISGNARDDKRFADATDLASGIHSAVCVPLKLRGETIGVMNLGTTDQNKVFSEYHMRLATILGEHASVTIMYSRLRRLQHQTTALR